MRWLVIALLLIPATSALAQSTTPSRNFALTDLHWSNDDLVVTLLNTKTWANNAIVSLADSSGKLVAPDQVKNWLPQGASASFTFARVNLTSAILDIQYSAADGTAQHDQITINVPPKPQDAIDARVVLDAVETFPPDGLALVLVNKGTASTRALTVSITDDKGAILGSPIQQSLDSLLPNGTARTSFSIPMTATTVRVVISYLNRTETKDVHLPGRAGTSAEWLRVTSANITNQTATIVIASVKGTVGPLDVSVRDDKGVNIADPLHYALSEVTQAGETLKFLVPIGTRQLVVRAVSTHAQIDFPLGLATPAASNLVGVTLTTDLPSRDSTPGTSVNYALTLTNTGPDTLLTLRADGLPSGYVASFRVDGSTVSSLRAAKDSTRVITATVQLPQGTTSNVGQAIAFNVTLSTASGPVARLPLIIQVKGQAQLELQGQNWFAATLQGTPAVVDITLSNTGTAPAFGVTLSAKSPFGWTVVFTPPRIERLDAGNVTTVHASVTPAPDAGGGKYVVDISAANADLSARPRTLSVEVSTPSSSNWPWIVGAAIAVAGGIGLIIYIRRR